MPSVLERLEALSERMTPSFPNRWNYELDRGNYRIRVLAPAGVWVDIPYDQADAEGIVAARNALPDLLAVAKAAQQAQEEGLLWGHSLLPLCEALAPLLREVE